MPFRICIKTIKVSNYSNNSDFEVIKGIKHATDLANRMSLWNNVCLVQSFTARWMFQRRKIPSTFYIGVAHDDQKKLTAHAWLTVNDIEIVPKRGDYSPITTY